MKANAPEKIYIPRLISDGKLIHEWNDVPFKKFRFFFDKEIAENIEYIRKDVFIERVCDWLSDTLQTVVDVNIPSRHHVESIPVLGIITQTEFIEKFKKEIEYLLD